MTDTSTNTNISDASVEGKEPAILILKIGQCPSLSGRSTLTYHIGHQLQSDGKGDLAGHDIQFRIYANTAGGFFSMEWVSAAAIQKAFEKLPVDEPVTAASLNAIFQGKSVNTAGFLLAVLKAEGLVATVKDKRRYYERASSEAFIAEINDLVASACSLAVNDHPVMPLKAVKKSKKRP